MKVKILSDYTQLSKWVASYIKEEINKNQKSRSERPFVLGLPTGGTIEGIYQQLVELYKQKKISFKRVVSFNMDEYLGLDPKDKNSYAYFMHQQLFNHVDMEPQNINLLDGLTKNPDKLVRAYEDKILSYGGIDLFVGGIGANGHLAFNEPFSSLKSFTHIANLTQTTIEANARYFDNDTNKVPRKAISVGINTIMQAKQVLLIVNGTHKAPALKKIIEEGVNQMYPASMLQLHDDVIIACDENACQELRVVTYKFFKSLY